MFHVNCLAIFPIEIITKVNGEIVDIGGCMNTLTPSRPQMKGTSSMSPNSCLVQVEKWTGGCIARKVA